MTEQTEIKIPFADLTRLTFECACGAEVTLDLLSKHGASFGTCPGCGHPMDSQCQQTFADLRKVQQALKESPIAKTTFFRIKKTA